MIASHCVADYEQMNRLAGQVVQARARADDLRDRIDWEDDGDMRAEARGELAGYWHPWQEEADCE